PSCPSATRNVRCSPRFRRRIFPSSGADRIVGVSSFLEALSERVLIFDGAMGTQIQSADLTIDDFWGQENNSEILNFSKPEVIQDIHARYLAAGADCIETNTFGANLVVQGEYGNEERVHELNVVAA